jgi:hypothetical protein
VVLLLFFFMYLNVGQQGIPRIRFHLGIALVKSHGIRVLLDDAFRHGRGTILDFL